MRVANATIVLKVKEPTPKHMCKKFYNDLQPAQLWN